MAGKEVVAIKRSLVSVEKTVVVEEAETVKETETPRLATKRVDFVRSEKENRLEDYRNKAGSIDNGMVEALKGMRTVEREMLASKVALIGDKYCCPAVLRPGGRAGGSAGDGTPSASSRVPPTDSGASVRVTLPSSPLYGPTLPPSLSSPPSASGS